MSSIICNQGNPMIEINGELIPPAAFRSFRPTPANISLFYRAGVRLYQMIVTGITNALHVKYSYFGEVWTGDNRYDFSAFDRQMAMFQKFAPDGYFCVMIPLDTRRWWLDQHPDVPDSFWNLGQAAVSEAWQRDAAAYLRAFIEYAETRYGDRIFAYSFSAGTATEWFTDDKTAAHPLKEAAYRKFRGDESAQIPTAAELVAGPETFREPAGNAAVYLDYCNRLIAGLICRFAAEAQHVLRHRKLVGLFFGYIYITSCVNQNLWSTNAYEQVWQSPDIDMLFSPAAYGNNRLPDGVSSYQVAVDSIAANGKLYLHEIDHRTHLAAYPLETGTILADCYQTAEETIAVLRRELCLAMVKNSALWWFDFFGGYFDSPEYEAEISRQMAIYTELAGGERHQVAEIAVFVDPMSFLAIKENVPVHRDYVKHCIDELLRCGAPFETYNLSDLPRIDKTRYKLFIFLNTFRIPAGLQAYIRTELAGRGKFFLHGAGVCGEQQLDWRRTAELTGMALVPFTAPEPVRISFRGQTYGFSCPVEPLQEIVDPAAEIWGDFADGRHGLGLKGNTFFSAAGNVPAAVWRAAARRCGVHIYSEQDGGLIVCSQFIAAYHTQTESCELTLPADCELDELFEGGHFRTENRVLRYRAAKGHTMLFRFVRSDGNVS